METNTVQTYRHWKASKAANRIFVCAVVAGSMLARVTPAEAQDTNAQPLSELDDDSRTGTATLPLVFCWYKGEVLFYIRTDTSDKATAEQQGLNYVPQLANVLTSSPAAYDDIYTFTNFTQYNVVPSAPNPVGSKNTDQQYQPLWQVSQVAWNSGNKPRTLKSEEEILSASKSGEVTLTKTQIIINCPIIFRPGAGKLPNVKIQFNTGDENKAAGAKQ